MYIFTFLLPISRHPRQLGWKKGRRPSAHGKFPSPPSFILCTKSAVEVSEIRAAFRGTVCGRSQKWHVCRVFFHTAIEMFSILRHLNRGGRVPPLGSSNERFYSSATLTLRGIAWAALETRMCNYDSIVTAGATETSDKNCSTCRKLCGGADINGRKLLYVYLLRHRLSHCVHEHLNF